MQISWSFALLAVVLLCDAAFAHPGHSHGYGHGHGHGRSARSMYKKSTRKSNAIGEYSNAKIREYKVQLNGIQSKGLLEIPEVPESCLNPNKQCDASYPYRSMDGTCNNLQHPYWGAAFTPLTRLVPAAYHDGFNEPRGGIQSTLPNARLISASIHPDLIEPDAKLTNMVPQIGQFLDHDMTLAPEADHRCCTRGKVHDDCWDITVASNDTFYSQHNQRCLDFTRSTPYCFPGTSGVREQMNSLTSFVDASQVYGSDNHRGSYLRAFSGGKLKVNTTSPGFLPSVESIESVLGDDIEIEGVYAAGDERVNEMPGLTTLHTLLFREHNRLADEIQKLRPLWDDEQVYQNARRILIAEWQHVIYGEYLPVILGPQTMAKYNLNVDAVSVYDPLADPSIIQAFSAAAYRFGHTLINGIIQMMRESSVVNTYLVRDGFFNDSHITSFGGQGYDLILNGLLQQNAQTYDRFVTEELSCFLLREPEDNFGNDLIARNIQRARDHGLQTYSAYRRVCNLAPLTTWDNVPSEIPADTWNRFKSIYASPNDIDLFPAGLAETPVPDGVTGPTFNCIKALQFYNVKFGDRFFYTHRADDNVPAFTRDQVAIINERTWGDIICDNSILTRTPRNVFRPAAPSNPWIPCNDPTRALKVEDLLE